MPKIKEERVKLRKGNASPKREKLTTSNLIRIFGQVDRPFLIIVVILICIGSVMVFSASYAYAAQHYGDSYYFAKRQIEFLILGVIAMMITSYYADARIIKKFSYLFYVAVILLNFAIFVPGLGVKVNGALRWIDLYFVQLQPSELLKLALILVCARYISDNQGQMRTFKKGFVPFIWIALPMLMAVLSQKHLSGTVICCGIMFFMMYVGGTHPVLLGGIAGTGVVGVAVVATFWSHVQTRLEVWKNPFEFLKGKGWQPAQSLLAIASGGFWGLGLGKSNQKHSFLPEPQNDYIFAIICEELGLFGAGLIIICYMIFAWRGYLIARNSNDRFASLVVLGLIFKTMLHVVLNIAVVTNTLPSTGITLPFMSYGGSSLIMQLVEIGIILSISRYSYSSKN